MSDKYLKIVIEVDGEAQKIFVTDNVGNTRELHGVLLVGGKPKTDCRDGDDTFYLFDYGCSTAIAWAFGRAFALSYSAPPEDKGWVGLRNFFRKASQEISKLIAPWIAADIDEEKRITLEELREILGKGSPVYFYDDKGHFKKH
jgi:hypothetical protein